MLGQVDIIYTGLRIIANLYFGKFQCSEACGCVSWPDVNWEDACEFRPRWVALADFVARPLVTVVWVFMRPDLFSGRSQIHT